MDAFSEHSNKSSSFGNGDIDQPTSSYLPPLGAWSDLAVHDPSRGTRGSLYVAATGDGTSDRMDTLWWYDGEGNWYATTLHNAVKAPTLSVAVHPVDTDTVYVTLSARAIRPDLVIISRARTTEAKAKMLLAGASRAINPQRIGGRRMAVFALQPDVAEFLDVVMHDEDLDFRIQQVLVGEGSNLVGHPLGELRVQERTGALLLAIRRGAGQPFEPHPPEDLVVPPGAVLIALGTPDELEEISRLGT